MARCVCVYKRELMLNISMFMLQQSHSLLSETFSYVRSLLSFVYVSIFIFLIPFFIRNAFSFFIRFAPSFPPDFIQHSQNTTFYS